MEKTHSERDNPCLLGTKVAQQDKLQQEALCRRITIYLLSFFLPRMPEITVDLPSLLSKSLKALLPARMLHIVEENERIVEEDLFSLFRSYLMAFPVFVDVPIVPLEANTPLKWI